MDDLRHGASDELKGDGFVLADILTSLISLSIANACYKNKQTEMCIYNRKVTYSIRHMLPIATIKLHTSSFSSSLREPGDQMFPRAG
jgi:hypothetical protein